MLFVTHDLGVVAAALRRPLRDLCRPDRRERARCRRSLTRRASLHAGAARLPSRPGDVVHRHPGIGAVAAARRPPGCRFAPRCGDARAVCTCAGRSRRRAVAASRAPSALRAVRMTSPMTGDPASSMRDVSGAAGRPAALAAQARCRRCARWAGSASTCGQGEILSAGRRVRLRQDHARPHHPRPAARERAARSGSTAARSAACRPRPRAARDDDPVRPSGRRRGARPVVEHRPHPRRRAADPRRRRRGRAARAGRGDAAAVGLEPASAALSARILRRPAAPRRARPHPGAAAALRDPRRADLRPRHVGAGDGAQSAARTARAVLP